jgi:hypothetical protein
LEKGGIVVIEAIIKSIIIWMGGIALLILAAGSAFLKKNKVK